MVNTSRNYRTPAVPAHWASSRNTDEAVAMAIHAIASGDRTPEAIWEAPTPAEWDHVVMALEDYAAHGDILIGEEYCWGDERVVLPA